MTVEVTAAPALVSRVARGVGALSLSSLVGAVGQLSLVPIAMYAWGKSTYGEWLLLSGLVTILKVSDIGLQTYVVNEITAQHARGDHDRIHRTLHSALLIECPLAAIALVLVAGLFGLLPVDAWLGVHVVHGQELTLVGVLLAAEILLGVPMGTIAGIYRATGRLPRAAMIGTVQQVALVSATLGLVALGAGFWHVAAARVAIAVAMSGVVVVDLKTVNPWLRLWPTTGRLADGLRMVGPGLLFLLVPVADYVSTQVVLVVLQRGGGAAEVSRLATHRTFVNVAVMCSGVFINAVWPELTAMDAHGDAGRLRRFQRTVAKFNLWLAAGVALMAWPVAELLYPRWTARELVLDEWVLAILIARVVTWSVWNVCATTLMATNRHRAVVAALWGSAMLSSVLGVALVPVWGVHGAALAWLIGDLGVVAWAIPLLACTRLGDGTQDFWREIAGAGFWGLALPLAIGVIGWRVAPSMLLQYGVVMPLAAALALVSMSRRLSPGEERVARSLGVRAAALLGYQGH